MELTTWLDADRGRLTALAAHFRLTQSAVSQWRANGVPPQRMKAVREFTLGLVTLDDMLPDVLISQESAPAAETAKA